MKKINIKIIIGFGCVALSIVIAAVLSFVKPITPSKAKPVVSFIKDAKGGNFIFNLIPEDIRYEIFGYESSYKEKQAKDYFLSYIPENATFKDAKITAYYIDEDENGDFVKVYFEIKYKDASGQNLSMFANDEFHIKYDGDEYFIANE